MTIRRSRCAIGVVAVFGLVGALGGCGFGPGSERGEVEVLVTRDFGETEMYSEEVVLRESDDVMRVLTRLTDDVGTAYGGGFVESIDGFGSAAAAGGSSDWFFFVDGTESPVGALEAELDPGDALWWDRREWSAATYVPAVVGSWPRPFGPEVRVEVGCLTSVRRTCSEVAADLASTGAKVAVRRAIPSSPLRVLVGPWQRIKSDPLAARIEGGPSSSGVYARFVREGRRWAIQPLDERGETQGAAVPGGLVAAVSGGDGRVTWIVTGTSTGLVPGSLRRSDLRRRYAVLYPARPTGAGPEGIPVR